MTKRSRKDKQSLKPVVQLEDEIAKEATGSEDWFLQYHLIGQAHDSLWLPESMHEIHREARIQSAISMLQGIKPTDEVEGMMATQMVATHNVAMDCILKAMIPNQTFEGRDQNLKHAAKFLSICLRQIEVLDKHRGKGQQKITVERVNVESGGQAIVGHVEVGKAEGAPDKGT